jgi:hypothetical protein
VTGVVPCPTVIETNARKANAESKNNFILKAP